ncbi:MAG: hypothetical protein HY922_14620 [Elusimicrobia bacterium]|nr:hypothetical protein [Elusimicrobiota bacterium]
MKPPWWNILGSETCMPDCAGTAYDPKKDCCDASGTLHKGVVANADGTCGGKPSPSKIEEAWTAMADMSWGIAWELRNFLLRKPDAAIECDGAGDYRPQMNFADDAPCGIRDCVTQHEKVHVADWQVKFVLGCAGKEPGTHIPMGEGKEYQQFVDYSECRASSKAISCFKNKLKQNPSFFCRWELEKYTNSQEDLKLTTCH